MNDRKSRLLSWMAGGAACLLLAGPAAANQGTATPGENAQVLNELHHSNQMEIQAGKLAQKKGSTQAVKDYGRTLVKDHEAADKQVKAAAKQLRVELPRDMPPMQDNMAEKAKGLSGPEFDRTFAEAMLEDHKRDIQKVTQAQERTTEPRVKQLLTDILPTLEKHEQMAQMLVDRSAGQDTAGRPAPSQAPAPASTPNAPTPPPTPEDYGEEQLPQQQQQRR